MRRGEDPVRVSSASMPWGFIMFVVCVVCCACMLVPLCRSWKTLAAFERWLMLRSEGRYAGTN